MTNMYERGGVIVHSYLEAYFWYNVAALLCGTEAAQGRDGIGKDLLLAEKLNSHVRATVVLNKIQNML
ncbi:MAG: hypothetical protein QS721_15480 [Candidatus Endonucleobacter sp. (ex Gigantidas childressi)]|nr:hypothetical protein [Candidatus Endonucleobacter sp. (ex Gigantidas childressi)]